jgi:ankyrin repeat protein
VEAEATAELLQKIIDKDEAAFIQSVERGETSVVGMFLSAGMDSNVGEGERGGEPVLVRAIRGGHVAVVEVLLDYGAKTEEDETHALLTALMPGVKGERPGIVRALLKHKAAVNAVDGGGHTALMLATMTTAISELPPQARAFVASDSDADEGSDKLFKETPKKEWLEIIRMLLDGGADVNMTADDCGLSALMLAALYGDAEVARIFLEKGADPNKGAKDINALHFAAFTMEKWLAELDEGREDISLDEQGQATSEETKKALDYFRATEKGRAEIALLLRQAGARERWEWPEEEDEPQRDAPAETP